MIKKTTRPELSHIRLTDKDRARLKPGECFIERGGKCFIRANDGTERTYRGGQRRRLKGTWIEVSGQDVVEAFRHAEDPTGRRSDWLLLDAHRAATTKGVNAQHLSQAELRAVAWFAYPPPNGAHEATNQFLNVLLDVWSRETDAVLRVIAELRKRWKQPGRDQVQEDFLARIFHTQIEQRSGRSVRRLENTRPNDDDTRRFLFDRL